MNEAANFGADYRGLSSAEVAERRLRSGWNELPEVEGPSAISIFLRQFKGLLVLILVAAAGIALALGEMLDSVAIALVLALNGVLGFIQEWRAETALAALRSMISPTVVVVRDGDETTIAARELVPDDLVIVSEGETVPADLRILHGAELRADESVLTGESLPVLKTPGGGGDGGRLFAGTALVAGRAEGVVAEIGLGTAFGRIAELTAAPVERETDLQSRLGQLAQQIGIASILIAIAVVALGWVAGRPLFEMFMTGLSLSVAMVPEGLPAVVTVTLALGASAMVRKNAYARRLQAVETLGAASVICTDKTGTLTENQMTVTRLWTASRAYEVTGTGYDPAGHIERDGERLRSSDDGMLGALLDTALLCNHARLVHQPPEWVMIGEPTEGALVTLAYKGWATVPTRDVVLAEKPFTSERKRMSVLARSESGIRLHMKGAPEVVLDCCTHVLTDEAERPLDEEMRRIVLAAYADMASDGKRVIGLASRPACDGDLREEGLVFVGLAGLIDPPRPEVASAIEGAKHAGIRVVMITGDGPVTARAVAREIGLGDPEPVDGASLDGLSEAALLTLLKRDVLFARTRPEQKLRIVEALQALGQIVAMTGDGVNDAPALKRADIGVAMGTRGTDVSKSAADLVLLDDNFATIVGAIAEGRRQFENVRKFVWYLLASNAGEVVAIVANLALGGPLVFLATQILWMNLITDSITAVALGLERTESGQMQRPPRDRNERILGARGVALIVLFGLYTGTASLWIFYSLLPAGEDVARTAAFTGMVVFEKMSVFAFRSLTQPGWRIGWFSNPLLLFAMTFSLGLQGLAVYWEPLGLLLRTVPLYGEHWQLIVALALPLVIVPEVLKSVAVTVRR